MNALKTTLGTIWFSGIFFIGIPAWILRDAGDSWIPTGGPGAWLALVAVAVVLGALIVYFVLRGDGTPVPIAPPRRFLVRGPYRWLRNPMYALYFGVIACEAWLFRSWDLVIYLGVFAAGVHVYVVFVEEPGLHRRFGEAYAAYVRRVPRWIPRLRAPREVAPPGRSSR